MIVALGAAAGPAGWRVVRDVVLGPGVGHVLARREPPRTQRASG